MKIRTSYAQLGDGQRRFMHVGQDQSPSSGEAEIFKICGCGVFDLYPIFCVPPDLTELHETICTTGRPELKKKYHFFDDGDIVQLQCMNWPTTKFESLVHVSCAAR